MTPRRKIAITLHIFVDVLRACPSLEYFGMALDFLSPIPALDTLDVQNDALVVLRFLALHAPPEEFDEAPLLAFVRAVCPSVRHVRGFTAYVRPTQRLSQVQRMQAELSAANR